MQRLPDDRADRYLAVTLLVSLFLHGVVGVAFLVSGWLRNPVEASRGEALFAKNCQTCHQHQGRGHRVGPDLSVIGTKAKHLSERDALSCVLGYTIGNDVSERTWQANDRTLWRAKNADTFKPMGPWIETDFDLAAAETRIRVNGAEKIRFKTDSMLFGPATFISRMSQYLTLYPGDVVWMGTEGAPENIKHGDTVEIEITGIGTLRNPVVRAGR